MIPPSVLVVMGVSGSGKTTIAALLAGRLHWDFEDADDLHPAANVAKMHAGLPLTDEDRWPWLHAVAGWIDATPAAGRHGVIACSALKRSYRAIIVGDRPDVQLIYLEGDPAVIARRLACRHGHFMPADLLESQLRALEEPTADEPVIVVSIERRPGEIADAALSALGLMLQLPTVTPGSNS
jgi:carbohydrate kinase (thermoresistant glucokinase family)